MSGQRILSGSGVSNQRHTNPVEKITNLRPTHGPTMSRKDLKELTQSIRQQGVKVPVTVTKYNGQLYILDGHHRIIGANRSGIFEVPIERVELPYGPYRTPADLMYSPGGY